jgi:predicted kinase
MKEVVILVGMPGAGKTHYCLTELAEHVRLSQDEGPRFFAGVFRRYLQLLEGGVERIVIDRTNPMAAQRARFVAAARQHGYRVKIIYFDVPHPLCQERIRDRTSHPTLDAKRMDQAIHHYLDKLDVPKKEEGDALIVVHPKQEDAG